jgi:hypothetical protein
MQVVEFCRGDYMQSYLVESSKDGQVITMGKRYARINRP